MHWLPAVRILSIPARGVHPRIPVHRIPETCINVHVDGIIRPPTQCTAVPEVAHGSVSVYAISDLHTDHHANMKWVKNLASYKSGPDSEASNEKQRNISVLLIAGDISDDMGLLRTTLEALVSKFDVVGFVPGNHELWVKGQPGSDAAAIRNAGASDSISKLHKVLELCNELGVLTQPVQIGGLYLVPLLAWHHQSWDKEADILGIPRASAMTVADYAACIWPADFSGALELGADATAAWFDAANESSIQQPGYIRLLQVLQANRRNSNTLCKAHGKKGVDSIERKVKTDEGSAEVAGDGSLQEPQQQLQPQQAQPRQQLDVISFSHFLPHQALLPEKRFLTYPNLAKAVGSDFLWSRLQQLQPDLHIFGHSHFAWDMYVQGIRCVQAPLCYPNERRHRAKSIILQHAPEAHLQGSNSDSSSEQQRHQSQQESRSTDEQHTNSVPWLPVKVYQACYTAELRSAAAVAPSVPQEAPLPNSHDSRGGDSSGLDCGSRTQRCILQQYGLPVVHMSETRLQKDIEQQLLSPHAHVCGYDNSTVAAGGSCYVITDWQGSWCDKLHGVWSEYYKVTAREPDNTELAPWVAKRYQQYPRLSKKLALGQKNKQ